MSESLFYSFYLRSFVDAVFAAGHTVCCGRDPDSLIEWPEVLRYSLGCQILPVKDQVVNTEGEIFLVGG